MVGNGLAPTSPKKVVAGLMRAGKQRAMGILTADMKRVIESSPSAERPIGLGLRVAIKLSNPTNVLFGSKADV